MKNIFSISLYPTFPYTILAGKSEGKRQLKIIMHRWEHMNWLPVAQDMDQWQALVNKVMNIQAT
jgi:hypothetical protein